MNSEARKKLEEELAARMADFYAALRKALIDAGHELNDGAGITNVDGESIWMAVDKQYRGGSSGYFSRPNGKLYYTLGDYGDRKTYREPNKGFDIAKAVERIEETVRYRKAQTARRAKKETAEAHAKATFFEACERMELDEESMPSGYHRSVDFQYKTPPVKGMKKITAFDADRVAVTFAVTPDQLEKLVKLVAVIS